MGRKGVQSLAFSGTTLENVAVFPADAFHIWHMRVTDLNANVLPGSGWGETNLGEAWDPTTHTETYTFPWGTVSTQFLQTGDTLNLIVTETNNAGSGVLVDGAEIYPFALHFPQDPKSFSSYTQYAITTIEPGVSIADFGTGVVTSVIPDESVALYGGWKTAGPSTYTPIMTSTPPDGLATFLPHNNAPVQPGGALSYTVSLRFTPEGTPASAADAYASFAATYPSQMTWTDKRAIGTAYLASFTHRHRRCHAARWLPHQSPPLLQRLHRRHHKCHRSEPLSGPPPRAGRIHRHQHRLSRRPGRPSPGTSRANNTRRVPATFAPPTRSPPLPRRWKASSPTPPPPTSARSLDDAYFKIIASAGFKIGLCLRPQVFTPGPNGTASQVSLTGDAAIIANLEAKAKVRLQPLGSDYLLRRLHRRQQRWHTRSSHLRATHHRSPQPPLHP